MAPGKSASTLALASAWCNRLDQFLTHLHRSSTSFESIAQRKPEPETRGDNVDSFLEDLNDDVSSALLELQKLEEDKDKSVKAEELFEICDALYKSNEDGIRKLELQLQQYGYTPVEVPEEIHGEPMQEGDTDSQNSVDAVSPPRSRDNLSSTNNYGASIVTPMAHSYDTRNTKRDVEYSPLFGDLGNLGSLESLGISATSLTALAGQDEPGEAVHPLQQKLSFAESPSKEEAKISSRDAEMEDNLMSKYGSHWKPEAESKHPPLSSVPVAKYVVFNKPVSEYGNGATISLPTTTVSKKDVIVQDLETKKVAYLTEVTSAQYDISPVYVKRMVSIQVMLNFFFLFSFFNTCPQCFVLSKRI
ncbi:hypothetical protein M758_4G030500 [Ceratodon purpureus]|nr:hypothetical protein M758_4G030500 [Ceratodon purpureus]